MLSQTAEYALRAVVCLAQHPGQPLTTQVIAELTRVPSGYLSKVMQVLGKAGLVTSQRGIHGGFCLAIPPEQLSILDIIARVDPFPRIKTCPLGLPGHGTHLCPLHRKIDDATAQIERAFADTTLTDLLRTSSPSTPLCDTRQTPQAAATASNKPS